MSSILNSIPYKKTNDNVETKLYRTIISKNDHEPLPSLYETTLSQTLWQSNFNHHETMGQFYTRRRQKEHRELSPVNSKILDSNGNAIAMAMPKLKDVREYQRNTNKPLYHFSKNNHNSLEVSGEGLKHDAKRRDKLSISFNLIELNKKKKQYKSFSIADKMEKDSSFHRLEKITEDFSPLGSMKSQRVAKRQKLVTMLKTKNFNLFKNGLTETFHNQFN